MDIEDQPPRTEADGLVDVKREGDEFVLVVMHKGDRQVIRATGYNTWRLFGMLAFMLGVKLPKKVSQAINLG